MDKLVDMGNDVAPGEIEYIVTKKTVQTVHYLVPAQDEDQAAERLLDEKSGPFSYFGSHIEVYISDVTEVGEGG